MEKKFTKDFNIDFVQRRDNDPSIISLAEKIDKEEEMVYGLFINLFNTFCNSNGLQSIFDIISSETLIKKTKTTALANYKLPLDIIATLLAPLKTLRTIVKEEVINEIVEKGEKAFFQRLQNLDEKEIKDIVKDNLAMAMILMKGFLKLKHSEEQASKIIDTHEMMLSLKYLQTPFLEKRLNGLADIKKMIEKVDLPFSDVHQSLGIKQSWLTSEYLTKWIVQHNILGIILNENTHAELVKRTSHILIFLAKKKAITKEIIELLWKCQQDKHEDIIRVVYDTIRDILDYITIDVFIYLFYLNIGY